MGKEMRLEIIDSIAEMKDRQNKMGAKAYAVFMHPEVYGLLLDEINDLKKSQEKSVSNCNRIFGLIVRVHGFCSQDKVYVVSEDLYSQLKNITL